MLVNFIKFSILIVLIKCDSYLNQVENECIETKQMLSCTKYKFLRYVEELTTNPDNHSQYSFTNNSLNNFIKIIYIPNDYKNEQIMLDERNIIPNSDYYKMWSFVKERLLYYLSWHAIGFSLPEGATIVEENEIYADSTVPQQQQERRIKRRHNRFFMIPILVLAKLFKVNILLGIILFGILVLKKILLAAALIFPAIIVSVKNACRKSSHAPSITSADRLVANDPFDHSWGWWNRRGDYRTSDIPT